MQVTSCQMIHVIAKTTTQCKMKASGSVASCILEFKHVGHLHLN